MQWGKGGDRETKRWWGGREGDGCWSSQDLLLLDVEWEGKRKKGPLLTCVFIKAVEKGADFTGQEFCFGKLIMAEDTSL